MTIGFHPQPKPRPRALEKRESEADFERLNRAQIARCKARAAGVCEIVWYWEDAPQSTAQRCRRAPLHNHHLIGGNGQRNVGRSILADHRQQICPQCHDDINDTVLRPVGEFREYAASVIYERRR